MTRDIFLRTPEFEAILERRKRYVTSTNHHPYKVGDKLKLIEFDFRENDSTGRFLIVCVLYAETFTQSVVRCQILHVLSISEPLGLSGVQN